MLNFSIAEYHRVLDKPERGAGYSVVLISVKQCSIHGSRAKYMAKKKDK